MTDRAERTEKREQVKTQTRADQAEALLAHPLLQQAFTDLRARYLTAFVEDDISEDRDHKLANMLRTLELFERQLKSYLQRGDVALFNDAQKRKVV